MKHFFRKMKKLNQGKTGTWLFRISLSLIAVLPFVITQLSPASFSTGKLSAHVEIDGVNFGKLDNVEQFEKLQPSEHALSRIVLQREFVTDPSLYLWAKNTSRDRTKPQDVHIVIEDNDGEKVSHYVLKYAQPLSWTVEAANPSLGGFHEEIELAVQGVQVR